MSRPSAIGGSTASSGWPYHCTAIVLSIVILSGLRVASAAPTSDQDWWINPCNKQPVLRHSRSPAETMLKRFLLEMNTTFFKEIKQLYKSFTPNKFKGNCPKIKKNLLAVKNAPTFTAATQAFYDTLLQFAAFIDKLKNTAVNTKGGEFDTSRRKHIFEEAKDNLKLLICEYNETLSRSKKDDTHLDAPSRSIAHKKGFKFHMKCLPDTMDHTQAHFMDIDFFKKLQKFLKQSRTFMRKKKAKESPRGRRGRINRVNSEQFDKLKAVTDSVKPKGRKSRH